MRVRQIVSVSVNNAVVELLDGNVLVKMNTAHSPKVAAISKMRSAPVHHSPPIALCNMTPSVAATETLMVMPAQLLPMALPSTTPALVYKKARS